MEVGQIHLILSDRSRRRVLKEVLAAERSVSELMRATRLRQPLVSHHLKVLRDAGLVEMRREGRYRLYRVASREIANLLDKTENDAAALASAAERGRE